MTTFRAFGRATGSLITLTGLLVCSFLPVLAGAEVSSATTNDRVGESATSTPSASTEEISNPYVIEKLPSAEAFGDFVVGPGRVELEIKPGESKTVEIFVSNRISSDRLFELSAEDVSGSADGKQAVTLLGEERGPYTIKDYISFPARTFPLNLGERARVPVTISIPSDAEPGGYYGSVLVSTTQLTEEASEVVAQSPIIARIGTLFFIRVPGQVVQSGEVTGLSLVPKQWWYESGPMRLNILFENTGSVHLNPYGELRITNLFGEEVGYVELEPWFVLPKSLRSREIVWDREFLFGRYTATAFVNRGYDDVVDEVSVSFYVLPWKVVAGVFFAVFIIVFGFRFFFRTFEFKRRGG